MYWIKFLIFSFGLQTVAAVPCDSSSDVTQCSDGEICEYSSCGNAYSCKVPDNICATQRGWICVSDYCQPDHCTSTGQCVHGRVCSQDLHRKCVYPIVINIEEGSTFTLAFKEPGTAGSYQEIHWYKGNRSYFSWIATINPIVGDTTEYYNDFCSGISPCGTSDRAHLNTSTGELTILNVKFSDEGRYYYNFFMSRSIPETGVNYEYNLNVYDCNSSSEVTQCSDGEICINNVCKDACDSSSDVTQCSEGEICINNVCESAMNCRDEDNRCMTTAGLVCRSDYCQPTPCTSTGQCVHGHVCSQDQFRTCVYPVAINVMEGSEVKLAFKEPGTPGRYEEIEWYKGGRSSLDRLAAFHPIITDSKTQYYNDFCSGRSPCHTSDRAHLNISTGELTIYSVQLSDEMFHYYKFFIPNGIHDTGAKYEYKLNIYVIPTTLRIEGVPSEQVEVGTNLSLTCTVERIRPLALSMYWVVHGRNETGALSSTGQDVGGAYTQTSTYTHTVTREDKSAPIRCVVVPVYGDPAEVETAINPGYAPFGRPRVDVLGNDHYEGDKVTLTCVNPVNEGNPPCDTYIWMRLEENINYLRSTQIHTFIMNQFRAGNYTCQCSNEFGESEVSDAVEMLYLGERPEISSKDNAGLIAGCVIGALVLFIMVFVAVLFCKKYQFNLQIKSRRTTEADKVDQEMDGYENPVNNKVYDEPSNKSPNEYHYIDDQRENPVNNNVNPEPENKPKYQNIDGRRENPVNNYVNAEPNEYHYVDVRAMDRAGDAGYMNPVVTTY